MPSAANTTYASVQQVEDENDSEIEMEQQHQERQQQLLQHQHPAEDEIYSPAAAAGIDSFSSCSFGLGLAFWFLGVFNNASYVIMIASAKTISEGGTAVVFLANIFPSMLIKLTAPYWFDHVSYERRMLLAVGCMIASFGLVASMSGGGSSGNSDFTTSSSTGMTTTTALQLLGVALGSMQSGLGEASLLAAAGNCDTTGSGTYISYFSSGTGFAGVFGFLWKFWWNGVWGCSMSTTLWLAQILALAYIGIFWIYLRPHLLASSPQPPPIEQADDNSTGPQQLTMYQGSTVVPKETQPLEFTTYYTDDPAETNHTIDTLSNGGPGISAESEHEVNNIGQEQLSDSDEKAVHEMTVWKRFRFVGALWPYIIPLFVVYATEYSLQAGTWTAIGIPDVHDEAARDKFYEFSNWMYQVGVFVSRSSGSLGTAPMGVLWFMPALQAANVVLFAAVAANHIWYSYLQLMPLCFGVGLLGGGVYVHGYKRICADMNAIDHREFALAATSVAESLGIVCADIMGLFIQACLYRTNGINGAMVSCPVPGKRW